MQACVKERLGWWHSLLWHLEIYTKASGCPAEMIMQLWWFVSNSNIKKGSVAVKRVQTVSWYLKDKGSRGVVSEPDCRNQCYIKGVVYQVTLFWHACFVFRIGFGPSVEALISMWNCCWVMESPIALPEWLSFLCNLLQVQIQLTRE